MDGTLLSVDLAAATDYDAALAVLESTRTPTGRRLSRTARRRWEAGERPCLAGRWVPRRSIGLTLDRSISDGARDLLDLILSLKRTGRLTEPTCTKALAAQRLNDPSTVRRQIKALEAAGYLVRISRARGYYSLLLAEKAIRWAGALSTTDIEKSKKLRDQQAGEGSRENAPAFKESLKDSRATTSEAVPKPAEPASEGKKARAQEEEQAAMPRPPLPPIDAVRAQAVILAKFTMEKQRAAERREAQRRRDSRTWPRRWPCGTV